MVICLERDANYLHMVQLMPLPLYYLCFRKSSMGYPSHTVLPRLSWKKGRGMTLCVRACACACMRVTLLEVAIAEMLCC